MAKRWGQEAVPGLAGVISLPSILHPYITFDISEELTYKVKDYG